MRIIAREGDYSIYRFEPGAPRRRVPRGSPEDFSGGAAGADTAGIDYSNTTEQYPTKLSDGWTSKLV